MNVYIKKGSGSEASPTSMSYDIAFKATNLIRITPDIIQGNFTVAIETLGFDSGNNKANDVPVTIKAGRD